MSKKTAASYISSRGSIKTAAELGTGDSIHSHSIVKHSNTHHVPGSGSAGRLIHRESDRVTSKSSC